MAHRRIELPIALPFMMLALLPMMGLAQGIRASEFNGGTLDTFWTFVDPRGGCTQSMTGTQASIDIPSGLSRDPVSGGQGGNRAPRLSQRVGPPGTDVGNFGIYAKFDGVQTRQYQIQGLMAIQDDKNYVRCEFFSDSAGMNALLYTFDNDGNYASQKKHLLTGVSGGTTPLFLRLDRVDTVFTQYYKLNESDPWILVDTVIHTMNVDSVAVYAANSDSIQPPGDTSAPAFTGLVDYFRTEAPLPVQLAMFTASLTPSNLVRLDWMTVSETNNYGFEVQKALTAAGNFVSIENSFIPGHGTTLEPHWYSYIDPTTSPGDWRYRLKQIDLDGRYHYSDPVEISVLTSVAEGERPAVFALSQNYPNPFNPSTEIRFSVATTGRAKLSVSNVLGEEVAVLFDDVAEAGKYYSVRFGADRLASGVYIYTLASGARIESKKMVLIR
jgi:hypothetical protein